ncbi:MAG: hypothetical protein V1861_01670 [Candidatus Micrarchaeota archaeon]
MTAILLAGIIILLFFLTAACGILAYLYLSPSTDGDGTGPGGNGGSISLNTSTTNISAEDMALWDSIILANVETACLQRAKEEAGASAGMVYSCACEETVQPLIKSYKCEISTADPLTEYFANIDCMLDNKSCTVETNYGKTDVPFSELRTYYSQ